MGKRRRLGRVAGSPESLLKVALMLLRPSAATRHSWQAGPRRRRPAAAYDELHGQYLASRSCGAKLPLSFVKRGSEV